MKKYLSNATIFSFNQPEQIADSIEITHGRITKIGTCDEVLPRKRKKTPISDLDGSLVMPGFTDSHIHLLAYGQALQRLDANTKTKAVCLDRIKAKAAETPSGKWIVGHGWDHNIWEDGYGTKEDLDKAAPHHPIYLSHKSLHSGWANSHAMKIAGIDRNTKNPNNGTILHTVDGEPSGILLEGAMHLVESAIPDPDEKEIFKALLAAQATLNRFGITSVHDFDPWTIYRVLNQLSENSELTLRVVKSIPEPFLDEAIKSGLRSGEGNDWIKIGWLKLFADGALGPQTAAMLIPYEKSDSTGMLFLNKNDVIQYGKRTMQNGIALAVHAIGDRANREVLEAYRKLNLNGFLNKPSLPSRIEHVQSIDRTDLHLFAENKIIASMQPIHAISDMDMADAYWGARCTQSYAWNCIGESGAKLIFGSDAPVETPNPFHGIFAAVTRKKINDHQMPGWTSTQCISLQKAIKAYCFSPHSAAGMCNSLGEIETGKLADLVILPRKFLEFSPQEIRDTLPTATMVNGEWVYKNDNIDIEFI